MLMHNIGKIPHSYILAIFAHESHSVIVFDGVFGAKVIFHLGLILIV